MKRRLLVLDDEQDMLRLLRRSLSGDLQCEVDTTSNAEQALEILERSRFDVVLADVRMPGMDGIDFLDRAIKLHAGLTVVMMTAYASIDLAVQAMRMGAYDFVTKPFEHDKLVHVLKRALERKQSRAGEPRPPATNTRPGKASRIAGPEPEDAKSARNHSAHR